MSPLAKTHLEALGKATDLFWEKGFHATSMRSLQQAIDLRAGSIYASFGSKEGLFRLSLNDYAQRSKAQLHHYVNAASSPLIGLKQYVVTVISGQSKAPSNMCMLVKTIYELTDDQADLLAEAKSLLSGMEDEFARVIEAARAIGEVEESCDANQMAQRLQIQFMGLRAYVRASDNEDRVVELVDDLFERL
jgi:AcrR family transcriptional regulator